MQLNTRLGFTVLLAAIILAFFWNQQTSEATSINIWKHRYPFYGGYGYYPFWGGYGGGYGGISIGGGGYGYGR